MKNVIPQSKVDINLRHKPTFVTPNAKSVYNGTETISFRGPQIWSGIPGKNAQSLSEFQSRIKEWKPKGVHVQIMQDIYSTRRIHKLLIHKNIFYSYFVHLWG